MTNPIDHTLALLNNNGDTVHTLKAKHLAVKQAGQALLDALRLSAPHARNYQTTATPTEYFEADKDKMHEQYVDIMMIMDYHYESATQLMLQENGG